MNHRKWTAVFITGVLIFCILNICVFNIVFTCYLILGIFLLIYFLKHPRTAFYLFVFSIPLAEIYLETRFLSISVPNILILIMITSLLPRFFITKPEISLPLLIKANLCALFFLVISYVTGALRAIDIPSASRFIITFMGMALSFVLPLMLIRNLGEYRKVFIFLIASASLLAFTTVLSGFGYFPEEYQSIFATRIGKSRAVIGKYFTQSFMASRGGYGCWLESALTIIMLSIFWKRKFFLKNLTMPLIAVIIILGIIVPSSRSTWLSSFLATLVIMSFVLRNRFRISYLIISIAGLLTILTLYEIGLIQPFIKNIYEMNPMGVEGRFLGYSESLRIAIQNPLFGIGIGGYIQIGKANLGMCIHNLFLSTLVSNGILGFLSLIFVCLLSFYLCVQIILRPATEAIKLFGVSLLASLIAIFTEANFYGGGDKIMWLMLGLTNCLYLININYKRSGKPKNSYKLESF